MRIKLALAFALLLCARAATAAQASALPDADRVRLAEAFRIGQVLGERIWKGWDKAPFAVMLVTPEREFLIRHPRPPKDFVRAGRDPLLRSDVYSRKRTMDPAFLATFPVGGVPTIVIGQAENTAAKTSTPWVVTLLHERLHQLQYSQPGYYAEVEALKLSGGDQTGMWMLNYAFPYADPAVKLRVERLSRLLAGALRAGGARDFRKKLHAYTDARRNLEAALAPEDYRYFSFQLWQEGVARYTEFRSADLIARAYRPTRAFRSLKDYEPFAGAARRARENILRELTTLQLDEYKRVAFYPLGAGEALLLDRANPRWRDRYFAEKFYLDKYFARAR